MSWRTAYSLDELLDAINAAAPDRSKAADGSIGDTAHSSRTSDHNPNPAGVVRARDFTHDPAGGFDAHAFAEDIRQLGIAGHPALGPGAYVISRGRIASATYGWDWRDYDGSNPHDHHTHVSVATAAAGYDSNALWGVMQEDTMQDADFDKIRTIAREEAERAVAKAGDIVKIDVGTKAKRSLATVLKEIRNGTRPQ
ncbi:hypothetical protein NPS01_25670 [Nocardioides psychrotolerans]|uniref:Uncharacterized protein n=1 Tax=Nocardioides psychrotolerans TaxID=1005945 RepID=A0A1I3LS27_9ACTN|nr:hypothetical protein [Nocardioides psychrotolerans]GEP38904.1 hypothetical protein NPS01_25670 [Nocardioides psychrotolerans]SFI87578.1 hypothetical protein SAMN05216561_11472 [Nocardioides psychrotolerans]